MSATRVPTFEEMMALFAEDREQRKEASKEAEARFYREMQKSQEKFDKMFEKIGNRLGELIESMVEGGIVRLFRTQGYEFTRCSRHVEFRNKALEIAGEVDLFLENGEYALLVEVKTNLSISDVKEHVRRLRKFRMDADTRGDKRQFLAAAGGGVIRENVRSFALKQGMYVIQQSGENVEIIPPEGKPKVW
jgi:Holliday junction resolvase-like predicted endonuclease